MRFGPVPLAEAAGTLLGHTRRLGDRVLKKGRRLTEDDLALFRAAGVRELEVATLDASDVGEDEAAARLAEVLAGPGVRAEEARTGRANLFATTDGLLLLDTVSIDSVNMVDEGITVATLPPFAAVSRGEMVGTVKIIPFAVSEDALEDAVEPVGSPPFSVSPFRPSKAGLVLTRLPAVREAVLDRGAEAQRQRVASFGGELAAEIRCDHTPEALAQALEELISEGCDPVLCLGASAIIDRGDVLPRAIEQVGGAVDHFGMPVDPGNLMLLGHRGDVTIIGVPSCARSLKPSGFDKVLARVLAGLEVTPRDVMRMGVGGLLHEVHARPSPRLGGRESERGTPRVAGLLLAAGRSARMGPSNKLLEEVGGEPIVRRAARALSEAGLSPVVVVLGHEEERVRAVLDDVPGLELVTNPRYAEGMGTSLARAAKELAGRDVDAAVVALGDMPWVRPAHVRALIEAHDLDSGRLIAVPTHGGKRGHPVLWSRRFLPELARLEGDQGARELLARHREHLVTVPVDDAAIHVDVDTPRDLEEARRGGDQGTRPAS